MSDTAQAIMTLESLGGILFDLLMHTGNQYAGQDANSNWNNNLSNFKPNCSSESLHTARSRIHRLTSTFTPSTVLDSYF